jgi:hypothetical protein
VKDAPAPAVEHVESRFRPLQSFAFFLASVRSGDQPGSVCSIQSLADGGLGESQVVKEATRLETTNRCYVEPQARSRAVWIGRHPS